MVYNPDEEWIARKYPVAKRLLEIRDTPFIAYCGGSRGAIAAAIAHHCNLIRYGNLSLACIDADRKETRTFLAQIDPSARKWFFSIDELMFDPTQHTAVPLHRKATAQEISKYSADKLPLLDSCDIIARWIGFSLGTIVAIEREENEVYFRVVV